MKLTKGFFITFEGGEGSGKTTQVNLLGHYLSSLGLPVLVTYEPGATPIGEKIRKLLLSHHQKNISREAETLLYLACRAQHVSEVIVPALKNKKIVICDRFTDSTLAYQGHARGIPLTALSHVEHFSRGSVAPDLTVLLDADPELLFRRLKHKHLEHKDRLESESLSFHQKVRKGYLLLAKKNMRRFFVADACKKTNELRDEIRSRVMTALSKTRRRQIKTRRA